MSYQQPGYPGAAPSPYGAPKKDNTLWWVLGGIGAVVLLCCCGVLGFFGFAAYQADQAIESYTSSSSSGSAGTPVTEGQAVTISDGSIASGWEITSNALGLEPSGIEVTNTTSTAQTYFFYVNFTKGGTEVEDALCTTSSVQPGESATASCLSTVPEGTDYDGLTISAS